MVRLTIRFVCVKNDKYHVLCITRDGLIWLGCHDFFKKKSTYFLVILPFYKGKYWTKIFTNDYSIGQAGREAPLWSG